VRNINIEQVCRASRCTMVLQRLAKQERGGKKNLKNKVRIVIKSKNVRANLPCHATLHGFASLTLKSIFKWNKLATFKRDQYIGLVSFTFNILFLLTRYQMEKNKISNGKDINVYLFLLRLFYFTRHQMEKNRISNGKDINMHLFLLTFFVKRKRCIFLVCIFLGKCISICIFSF